ncbi:MFS transporter [Leucobacter chromiireducens]|nr:MFS transporter [Leucobacter chromiireducens]
MSPPHVLAVCAVSQVLIILDTTVLSVATPHIGTELGMTELSLPYISHSYTTALAAALLLSGRLADSLGRRRILAWGLAALGLASLIGALAPTALVLLGARFLQGLAAAAVLGANLALLVECFPEQSHRLRALGIWGAAGGSGGALGALLGGIMVEAASWRLALLINVPVVILLLLWPMRRSGTDRHGGAGAVDVAGGCLLAITLVLAVQGTVALTAGAPLPASCSRSPASAHSAGSLVLSTVPRDR